MARKRDDFDKKLQKYTEENSTGGMTIDDINELTGRFVDEHNRNIKLAPRYSDETSALDYLELAEDADDPADALKYAKKALSLEPDNLDARLIVIQTSPGDHIKKLAELEKAVSDGYKLMEKMGYADDDCIGDYWLIAETRPFMRLLHLYMTLLSVCGMYRKAMETGEEILRLCKTDNLGVRYSLMSIYALLETETKARELFEMFCEEENKEQDETQLLLPLSVLYFKLCNFDKAEKYLKRLADLNNDTKKFMHSFVRSKFNEIMNLEPDPYGYTPNTLEELEIALLDNLYLYYTASAYFEWADKKLAALKRKKK